MLKCWGSNSNGQIGDGTKIDRSLPVNVTNIIPTVSGKAPCDCRNSFVALLHAGVSSGDFVRSLSLGQRHSCAVMLSGTLQCWGSNSNGQLGLGVHPFVRFASRKFHLFATGDTVDRLTATFVKGLSSAVVLVVCGSRHTCLKLRGTNRLMCFGLNDFGQSSLSASAPSSVPVTELKFIENPGKEGFSSTVGVFFIFMSPRCFLSSMMTHFCCTKLLPSYQLLESSTVVCTRVRLKRFEANCTLITKVRSLTALLSMHYFSRSSVYCWGFNLFGELGDGSFISRRVDRTILNWPALDYDQTAIQVKDSGRGIRAVVSGHHNTCILANGHCNYGDLPCQQAEVQKCSSMFYSTLALQFSKLEYLKCKLFQGNQLTTRFPIIMPKAKRLSVCTVPSSITFFTHRQVYAFLLGA